jgi:hypothetical protein
MYQCLMSVLFSVCLKSGSLKCSSVHSRFSKVFQSFFFFFFLGRETSIYIYIYIYIYTFSIGLSDNERFNMISEQKY